MVGWNEHWDRSVENVYEAQHPSDIARCATLCITGTWIADYFPSQNINTLLGAGKWNGIQNAETSYLGQPVILHHKLHEGIPQVNPTLPKHKHDGTMGTPVPLTTINQLPKKLACNCDGKDDKQDRRAPGLSSVPLRPKTCEATKLGPDYTASICTLIWSHPTSVGMSKNYTKKKWKNDKLKYANHSKAVRHLNLNTRYATRDICHTGTRIWPSAGDIASRVAKILLRLWAVVTLDPLRSGL